MERETLTDEDTRLLSLPSESDKEGFNALFHKYYEPLCIYAYQFVSFEDVEEIVQDVLLWIWQNRDTLLIRSSLKAYLYRSVHLRCLTRIEQNSAKKRMEARYWERYSSQSVPMPDDAQVDELLNRIHEAINRLPDKFREAFVLHRFQDRSYKEIAEQLNVSQDR
ncbi:MAG: RNA polymerase sigma-70 factor [Prevotella sp.]|jgi:RNA polymerase sigma-70 factor (ECF subfamily)|nr:RNA polymerase sigma-70 factor [Prevotella sp.]MCI2080868.1 RNA polymerase sigma-70 factor [Prevotella sp.]MCI2102757.1 RNA polymerase sigma-70 factor [Prevotella sp.]